MEDEQYVEAEREFHEAALGLPRAAEYRLYELWAQSRSLDPLDAATVQQLEDAALTTAKQDSGHAFPPHVLGYVALNRGDEETALRYFTVAYHRSPTNTDAANQIRLLSRGGKK